jgi:16S rRNA G527 N7-methylase RsmG
MVERQIPGPPMSSGPSLPPIPFPAEYHDHHKALLEVTSKRCAELEEELEQCRLVKRAAQASVDVFNQQRETFPGEAAR